MPGSERFWAFGLGLLATAVVAGGPRAVSHADRVAVPLLLLVGGVLTFALLRLPASVTAAPGNGSMTAVRGLDVVIGYQVSWLLVFGDYPRYTRSPGKAAAAVFLGLALTSLWFLPLGFVAARAAGSTNPGAMLAAAGIGGLGAVLLAHFFLLRRPVAVADLYAEDGPASRHGGFAIPGMCGWAAGAAAYFLAGSTGGTLPALLAALVVTWGLERSLP